MRRGRGIADQDFTIMEIKSKDMNSKHVVLSITVFLSQKALRLKLNVA